MARELATEAKKAENEAIAAHATDLERVRLSLGRGESLNRLVRPSLRSQEVGQDITASLAKWRILPA